MGVVTEGNLMACLLSGRVQPEDVVTTAMYKQFKKVGLTRRDDCEEGGGRNIVSCILCVIAERLLAIGTREALAEGTRTLRGIFFSVDGGGAVVG